MQTMVWALDVDRIDFVHLLRRGILHIPDRCNASIIHENISRSQLFEQCLNSSEIGHVQTVITSLPPCFKDCFFGFLTSAFVHIKHEHTGSFFSKT